MNAQVEKTTATAVHKGLYAALAAAQADMGPALKAWIGSGVLA